MIEKAADDMAKDDDWADLLLKAPKVLGIQDLGADAVEIRLHIRTDPGARSGRPARPGSRAPDGAAVPASC